MLRQSRYITSSAMDEAADLGHPELDVEHLLLGLLVTGGPSASLLIGAGVDLPGLRRAVAELQQQDLGALGLSLPPPVTHDGLAPSARAAQLVPFNDRALALMKQVGLAGDDRSLLLALLDDDGQRVERVLAHLDVDVAALRRRAGDDGQDTGEPSTQDNGEPGTQTGRSTEPRDGRSDPRSDTCGDTCGDTRCTAAVTQDLPVSAPTVWALVSDVTRRPEWDGLCVDARADADGVEHLTYRTRGRDFVVQQVVSHLVPGREVSWHLFRGNDRPIATTYRLRVEPVGTTCRLHLSVLAEPRGLRGRLLHPLTARMAGSQLRFRAQDIARAATRPT